MSIVPNPYEAPLTPSGPVPASVARWDPVGRSMVCLGLSFGFGCVAFAGALSAGSGQLARIIAGAGVVGATCAALLGAGCGAWAIIRALRLPPPRLGAVFVGLLLMAANGVTALFGSVMVLFITGNISRGRQLRRFGRVLLPRLRPGNEWAGAPTFAAIDVDERARAGLAAQWRENARSEHASVAAFAQLTLNLVALGAPPEIVAASNQDGLDEIRHAQMCLSFAAAIDGKHETPGPFPAAQRVYTLPRMRPMALATLAVNSLVDGALYEGVSARVVARLARAATVPGVRDVLKQIAADEGRHAAHGWDVVEWCVREGGEAVIRTVEGAARVLPDVMRSSVPAAAGDGAWERWGIPGRALEAEEYGKSRAHIVARVRTLRFARESATRGA